MTGRIDFLEMFSGSAKPGQSAAMQGLRVGSPIDLRTGYDLLTAEGRRKAMEVIERQQPKIIHMAPVCGPWSQMQNINDPSDTYQKRKKYLPMVEFCARVALYQIEHGRYFIIENPATAKIWFTKCFQRLLLKHAVTYGTLDMCAFGMRDPNGYYYYKPTSLLHNFPEGVLNPVFKRCSNKSKKDPTHYHQQLEGSAPGYGSRTKLAQVYPYRFCSTLIRCILPLGNPRALYSSQLSLAVDLLEDLNLDELRGVQNQLAALTASEHPVLATDLYEQGLPVRDYYYTKRLLNRINALPARNVYHPVQIEAQQDVSHVRQMYLSTSMFDNATILRGSFQSLRVEYRHTHGVLLLWKKKDTSHVFLRVHPRDMSQLIASHWSAILFWNNDGMEVFLQTIPTTHLNRTPTSTLHRVFHLSRTTTKMMTTPLNSLTLHLHHHTFQTFPCQMNHIRRIPAFLLMMIIFKHHFIHHHDQVMIHQMMKCIHHKMNHQIYHLIHHHHLIILNHHSLEPLASLLLQVQLLCPIPLYHQTLTTHQ